MKTTIVVSKIFVVSSTHQVCVLNPCSVLVRKQSFPPETSKNQTCISFVLDMLNLRPALDECVWALTQCKNIRERFVSMYNRNHLSKCEISRHDILIYFTCRNNVLSEIDNHIANVDCQLYHCSTEMKPPADRDTYNEYYWWWKQGKKYKKKEKRQAWLHRWKLSLQYF